MIDFHCHLDLYPEPSVLLRLRSIEMSESYRSPRRPPLGQEQQNWAVGTPTSEQLWGCTLSWPRSVSMSCGSSIGISSKLTLWAKSDLTDPLNYARHGTPNYASFDTFCEVHVRRGERW